MASCVTARSEASNAAARWNLSAASVSLVRGSFAGGSGGLPYGEIRAALEARGERIGGNDLWIAAHAKSAGLILVTNNEREFSVFPASSSRTGPAAILDVSSC